MLANSSGKLHKWSSGDDLPDTMYSVMFGGLTNDPNEVLGDKAEEWCRRWQCDNTEAIR